LTVALARYCLIATLTAVVACGILIVATSLLFSKLNLSRQLDTGSLASDAFFGVAGDVAAVYNRSALSTDRPQVILVGASNFQSVLASELNVPGFQVANISVAGSGIAEISRLVDLAYEAVPSSTRGHNVFVVGVWYGEFCGQHGSVWESLKLQLTGYGLYRVNADNSVERAIPRSLLSPALTAIRPLLVEKRLWGSLQSAAAALAHFAIFGEMGSGGTDQLAQDAVTLDAAGREKNLLEERKALAGSIDTSTFTTLDRIVARITRNGDRAIIVDLPIPKWHAEGVSTFAAYQQAKTRGFAPALSRAGVGYLDLQSSLQDEDFYDSVHPKPLAAVKLSHLIDHAVLEAVTAR
jgi:hypothetical protein